MLRDGMISVAPNRWYRPQTRRQLIVSSSSFSFWRVGA